MSKPSHVKALSEGIPGKGRAVGARRGSQSAGGGRGIRDLDGFGAALVQQAERDKAVGRTACARASARN